MPPIIVDVFVCLDDLAVKGHRRPGVRRRHGDDGVDRVRLVVGHDEHCPRNNSSHRVAQHYHRGRVGKIRVSVGNARIEVEREDVANRLIEVFGLVEEGLPVERRDIFIEIDGEEVEASDAGVVCLGVMLQDIVEVVCCLRGNGSDLLVAPGIARNEENGDSSYLRAVDVSSGLAKVLGIHIPRHRMGDPNPCVMVNSLFAIHVQRIFACETGVFRIELVELGV